MSLRSAWILRTSYILSFVALAALAGALQHTNRFNLPAGLAYFSWKGPAPAMLQVSFILLGLLQLILFHALVRAASTQTSADRFQQLAFLLVLLLVAAVVPPFTSADIYYYLGLGRLQNIHGLNPYIHAISSIPGEPMAGEDYWAKIPTMYGPLMTALFRAPTAILAAHPLAQIFLYRLIVLGTVMATLLVVERSAQRLKAPVGPAVVAYGSAPLLLHEGLANGHNEIFPIFFLAAAVLTAIEDRWFLSLCCLAIAGLLKFPFFMAGPMVFACALRAKGRRALIPVAAAVAVGLTLTALAYLAYFREPGALKSLHILRGLWSPSTPGVIAAYLSHEGLLPDRSIVKMINGFRYAFVVLVLFRAWRIREARQLPGELVLIFFCFCAVFSPYVWPWYWISILPMMLLDPTRRFYWPMMGLTLGTFLFWGFWNQYRYAPLEVAFPVQYALITVPVVVPLIRSVRRWLDAQFWPDAKSPAGG